MLNNSELLKKEFQDIIARNLLIFNWITNCPSFGLCCYGHEENELWVSDFIAQTIQADNGNNAGAEDFMNRVNRLFKENFSNKNNILVYEAIQVGNVSLPAEGRIVRHKGKERLILKFLNANIAKLTEEINQCKKLTEIYEETNNIAHVGGWESDLINNKITWTKVTRDIHEVGPDFEPDIEKGTNFFKEGWSRDRLRSLFSAALKEGTPFDAELKITTAKGNDLWVRSFGKPEMKNGKAVRIYGAFQDIDVKKKQEIEYRLTKERFETIFNKSSIGIVLVNKANEVLMANPASLSIFGLNNADADKVKNYLSYMDLVHPDDLEEAELCRRRLINAEISSYNMVCRYFKTTGEIIWCRLNASMVKAEDAEDDFIIVQLEDITTSKYLEQEAVENANLFISAFEHSPNGMALVGLEGNWLMVNEVLTQMIGYTKEEFLKLSFQDLTYWQDLDTDLKLLKEVLSNKRDTYSIEKRYIHKNGSIVYGLLNVSIIRDKESNPLYFVSQINDITKKVHAQQELQKSLNEHESLLKATTGVSIIQADLNGVITKFNKGAENFLGYSAGEVVGIKNVSVIHDEREITKRGEELSKVYWTRIEGFEAYTFKPKLGMFDAYECTYIRKDGTRFPVHLVVSPIVNHNGKTEGFVGIATDISQLKEMEASLMQAKTKAEAANQAKSEFLANMSHEIRTPLNGVIGFADLLMKTELNEIQKKYMQIVNSSAHTLLDLINDILDFSKIEAGKLDLNKEKADIIEICAQAMDTVKHQAHVKGLELLLDVVPTERFVHADPVRLKQILTNLLGNAVKFTKEGEVELKVRSLPCPECRDEMVYSFSIRDTGVGIAPHNLQKIFNAFDQEDSSTTRKYGGTGLGITISNRLLELMNSSLKVESEVNIGSIFSFNVRLKTEHELYPLPKININKALVVDDNSNNLAILNDILVGAGIETELISNGIEAIEILEARNDFDVAIIDFSMPYMSGIDLIEHIRKTLKLNAKKLPIMLMHNSVAGEKLLNACHDLKVRYDITKPISSNQLLKLLSTINKKETTIEKSSTATMSGKINKTFNILIAEDNPVNQMLAKSIVQKALPQSQILIAEDGQAAVEIFMANEIDLIFMDIQMPRLSGFEATEKIRSLEKPDSHLPIIALTARALKGEQEECFKSGMDDYITKPIVYDTIEKILKENLVENK